MQIVLCQAIIASQKKRASCLICYGMPINDHKPEHEVEMLSKKFLYEIFKQARTQKLNRKELAVLLQISPGYLSQIFHSKKPLTFEMLVRLQQVLHIEFEIKAIPVI